MKHIRKLRKQKERENALGTAGYYVYGWYHLGENLPFYIGKGKNDRAWRSSKANQVIIYRQGLTEEGAFLVESVLISVFSELGAMLENKSEGRKRQEKPPLAN